MTIFLDFGHNPEGVRAVMQLVTTLRREAEAKTQRKGKLTIVTGSPGDRSDQEIADVACILHEAQSDRVFVRELGEYLRGRAPGDVPALYRKSLVERGFAPEAFAVVDSEVDALERALDGATARRLHRRARAPRSGRGAGILRRASRGDPGTPELRSARSDEDEEWPARDARTARS